MEEEIFNNYKLAGKIIAEVFADVIRAKIVKPGSKIIEIIDYIENKIQEKGGSLAFPLNLDINEVAAHYTSPINDESIIPEPEDNALLVKLDGGVSIDGYLSDHAITINLGGEKYDKFYDAAHSALMKAIALVKPGVRINELGETIQKEIKSFNLKPISNLSGHQLTQFNLHAGATVPNIKTDLKFSEKFEEGDVFAIEPFSTDGSGYVQNKKQVTIYSLKRSKLKNAPAKINQSLSTIYQTTKSLPFSPRWFTIPEGIFKRLLSLNAMRGYPVLVDSRNGAVAQAEHTIIVTKDGVEITTIKN